MSWRDGVVIKRRMGMVNKDESMLCKLGDLLVVQ